MKSSPTQAGRLLSWMDTLPWGLAALLCLTLGLAPFAPPHVVEKLNMLFRGALHEPIDWFDLTLHGSPWLLLILKGARTLSR